MCGISGILTALPQRDLPVVEEQIRLLHHRGPDAAGHYEGTGALIAQNRLAIIDVVHGDPPITDESGAIGVVLNGEIYNFRQLQRQLRDQGHRLATQGDTEVIAHLAENHEPLELASQLDGMFAIAIWDGRRERLVLARDRLGKKPLYYWTGDGILVFGSEIKAVLAHPAVPARLNPRAIPAYLSFGYVPTPETFFEGIRSVPPGCVLVASPGAEPQITRYWEPQIPGPDGIERLDFPLEEAARETRRLLERAVERRLVSDVPLGAFLSGGIDSSAIVGVMASLTNQPVETFTMGFDDVHGFDERPFARAVATRHGTNHHERVVAPDAVDLVERLVWHHDQPFGDSSAVPTYLLSQVTREGVAVALSGDGGDELFAGYERFAAALAVDRYGHVPAPVRRVGRRLIGLLPPDAVHGRVGNVQRFAHAAELGLPDALAAWVSFIERGLRDSLLLVPNDWAFEDYREYWDATAGGDTLDRVLKVNLQTYLLDDLLVKADRMSMAHGLEVRSPFLDTELVEFALRLAPAVKVRGLSLKRVLKEAVRDLLPPDIIDRPKRGFGVPLDRWFREDLGSYVDATLGSSDARVRSHLRPDAVDGVIARHRAGEADHGHALWTLLTLEVFLRARDW